MLLRPQRFTSLALAAALAVTAGGCSSDDDASCDVARQSGCDTGLVCEPVEGGKPACVQPLVISGSVFDLETDAPIAEARVVALDANRSPISTVAITDAGGEYRIQVSNPRTRDGAPVARDVFLRADAQGYATFPSGIREALPIHTSDAARVDGELVVSDPQTTDVGLIDLGVSGTGIISGTAAVPASQPGVLVVAEAADGRGFSALADRNGEYAIFNLAPGDYGVRAYARGAVHEEKVATVSAGAVTDVDLAVTGSAGGSVAGGLNYADASGIKNTSVILVVESTFDDLLLRGETPPGLRAPETGAPSIAGAWEIAGVPPGRYVALAAFENDLLVRDPDQCIAGTEIQHVDVAAGAPTGAVDFKVTGALNVISPGANGPEPLTTTAPTFSWEDDSSEDGYELTVIDAFGHVVWGPIAVAKATGTDPAVEYTGAPLAPGYYQFKVKSYAETTGARCYKSSTEDLKGVFIVPASLQ